MSWSLPIYQSVALSEFFQQAFTSLAPASVCLNGLDGKSLWVESQKAADLATLPSMAQTCNQYLNLNDGEIAICNDPYIGGSDLSNVTFVIGLGAVARGKSDFIYAVRFALEPHWVESGKLADEGVRIPPTPVGTLHAPNWDLLAMIGSQPHSPRGFDHALRVMLDELLSVHASLQLALSEKRGVFHKACGKDLLADSARAFHKQIGHLALGESFASTRLLSGELIKLRLKVEDAKITFDFSGTDVSTAVQLTELMTFGTCFAAVRDVLGGQTIANSGSFDSLIVSAPAKTLLNAKAPAGTWRGTHEGVGQLFEFLVSHLRKLNKISLPTAIAAHAGYLDFDFDENSFFFALPNGANASPAGVSNSVELSWRLSAEELERQFPLYVKQFGERRNSGGIGKISGGNRQQLTLETLRTARVRWNFTAQADKSLIGSITKIDANRTDVDQPLKGSATLAAGEAMSFASASGHGLGDLTTEDDN